MRRGLGVLVALVAVAQAAFDAALLDEALASVRRLAVAGLLAPPEEEAAVRQLLQQDERLLLLAKHFGGTPGYASHLRAAVSVGGAATTNAPPPPPPPPPPLPPLADLLSLRRSVKQYRAGGSVPEATLARAFAAAVLAPNHFLTQPWRFYLLGPTTRGKVLALNEKKADEFGQVPGWLVATIATEYDDHGLISTKKGLEDHAATACALQNFMLSLAAEGYGSKWMTGALGMAPDAILAAIGADPVAERFMGVIWHGAPEQPLGGAAAPARSKGVDGVLKRLA